MTNDNYTVWVASRDEIVEHCDRKIDSYFGEMRDKQDKLDAKMERHNKIVEKYLKTMADLVKVLSRRK